MNTIAQLTAKAPTVPRYLLAILLGYTLGMSLSALLVAL